VLPEFTVGWHSEVRGGKGDMTIRQGIARRYLTCPVKWYYRLRSRGGNVSG